MANYEHRIVSSLMSWDVLPSAALEDWYNKIPFVDCLCPCGDGKIKTLEYVLFYCKMYNKI